METAGKGGQSGSFEREDKMDTIKINSGSAKMIAHRGLSGLETENSIPAFTAAGNRSYYGVETDVHVTGDGRFIVIHDNCTGRVAEDDIDVEKASYSLVRKIILKDLCPAAGADGGDVRNERTGSDRKGGIGVSGRQDLVVPSLQEYVGICKKYGKKCILELKNMFAPEDIERMLEEIKRMGYLENMVFISFCLENLIVLRKYLPGQEIYYLTCEYNQEILKELKENNLYLDIYYPVLTKEIVDELHGEGILVNCWTRDDKNEAERLAEWGVDYITSNILE